MAYDENLILHGVASGGVHLDLDENGVNALTLAVNATGNKCLDIRKTGAKGLVASLILTEVADADAYSDESTIFIEDSDHLDRGWARVTTFPTLYAHIRRIWVTTTVGFNAADIGAALTSQAPYHGQLLAFDDALLAVGSGYVYVEMTDAGDLFTDAVGQTVNGTTGRSTVTRVCVGLEPNIQMQPHIYNRRFSTNKRYIRANILGATQVTDSLGICWILLTNDASVSPDPF